MYLSEIYLAPWIFPADSLTRQFIIKSIFGEKLTISDPKFEYRNVPPAMKAFIDKYGAVLMKAIVSKDERGQLLSIPFFGNGSDWGEAEHESFLKDYINGADADDLFSHIHGDDDIDYFMYDYGANGDAYDIEDMFSVPELDDDFQTVIDNMTLAEAIKYGGVSMEWLKAAKATGVANWNEADLKKLSEMYSEVQGKL
jgi:hypothetical protein